MSVAESPRIAIVSTPRCGNTWLLHALRLLYDVPGTPADVPGEIDWSRLPPGFVFQLHWHPTPAFLSLLAEHRFQVVALTRHPLDCLISVLHFSLHERTEHWLQSEAGDERPIFAAMPRSAAFLDYAVGPRAAALFSVSTEWMATPGTTVVRYEDLVRNTAGELLRLSGALGVPPVRPVEEAVAATTLQGMRALTDHDRHFWMGQPGLWRRLLPAAEALRLAAAHVDTFRTWGYDCEPDIELSGSAADATWTTLARNNLGKDLAELRRLRREIQEERKRSLAAAESAAAELSASRALTATTEARATTAEERAQAGETLAAKWQRRATDLYARLEDLHRLGPFALGLARQFHAASVRYPNVSSVLQMLGPARRSRPGRHGPRSHLTSLDPTGRKEGEDTASGVRHDPVNRG